jgi:thiosulfate/3-mercaptopyruvate sulfurtransferase
MSHPIITADSLHDRLSDPDVTIVDCRFALTDPELWRQQYVRAHLPGAYYLHLNRDLSSPVGKHGGRHPLPDTSVFEAKLAQIGVNDRTLVVAYDDSRFAFAARLWWLLRYYGHDRVVVLDGGYSNWVKAGYPVTDALPEPAARGNIRLQPQPERIVDIDSLSERLRQRVRSIQDSAAHILIDSREPDRYLGKTEPIDPRAGHIPGAVNYPWQDVSASDGFILPVDGHRERWGAISREMEPIVYCGSGVTACVNLLSMELAGISGAKLYPGSWSDWCSYDL